jgi:hypothetical protein
MKKTILSLSLFSALSISSHAQNWAHATLDINSVSAMVNSNGDLFWDYSQSRFEVPKGGGAKTIFADAFWMGGLDAGGQLHLAAQTYRQTGNDSLWNKVWKINKSTIDSFRLGLFTTIPDVILNWPGNGNVAMGQAADMEDFIDTDADGIYSPANGDYPCIKGDQAVFMIFNDGRNIHGETGGQPMNIEIHAMLYAFSRPGTWLDTMVFLNYKVFNRSTITYLNAYIGSWTDFDIGAYDDDFIACDVRHDMYYGYNGDANDGTSSFPALGTYGANPPSQGVMFLRGPVADSLDGIDNNHDGTTDEPGEFCTMSKFIYYNNDFSVIGNPVLANEYYNYMRGYWKDSSPMTYDGNGYGGTQSCNYMFPGNSDPYGYGTNGAIINGNWSEETVGNTPFDRRGLGSSGPFTFMPDQEMCLDFAYIFGRGNNGPQSGVQAMRADADSAKLFYASTAPCSCVASPLAVNEISNTIHFEIYPNPASSSINVDFHAKNPDARIDVYDVTGSLVFSEKISRTLTQIDLKNFPYGIYLIRIIDGEKTGTTKLIRN